MSKVFLRIVSIVLVGLIFCSCIVPIFAIEDDVSSVRIGDVNGDNSITSADALSVLQIAVGSYDTPDDIETIDVNEDGFISSLDALYILQYIVGQISFLPAELSRAHARVYIDGVVDVVYYSQSEEPWKSSFYGDYTIGDCGCGPTSMAIVISSLTKSFVDPVCLSEWAYLNGHQMPNGGSYWTLFPAAANNWGLRCTEVSLSDEASIINALQTGSLVICSGRGDNPYTKGGHLLVLRGITSDGNFLMADPYKSDNNFREWSMSEIQTGLRGWWIISN